MHWLNDLPGLFAQVVPMHRHPQHVHCPFTHKLACRPHHTPPVQINRCLNPKGVFLATILGGETPNELRFSVVSRPVLCACGGHVNLQIWTVRLMDQLTKMSC